MKELVKLNGSLEFMEYMSVEEAEKKYIISYYKVVIMMVCLVEKKFK